MEKSNLPLLAVTPAMMVSELRRELKMRSIVYPAMVANKKLSQSDADHRIRVLDHVLSEVERMHADALRPAQADMLQ